MVATLLRKNFRTKHIVTNTQIIDSFDKQSDEVDVVVCNEYQPFRPDPHQPLLIAEGVDVAIQVKAGLDKREIERVFTNARTVKQLRRQFVQNDTVAAPLADTEPFIVRVPYFCFAFSTRLTDRKLHDHIIDTAKTVPPDEQPDAIFVLNRCVFLNLRDNTTSLAMRNPSVGWSHTVANDQVLALMLRYIYRLTPTVRRSKHPILFYPLTFSES
ncbi:DUF6602 domain-containing protein [Catellatospora coxensis]